MRIVSRQLPLLFLGRVLRHNALRKHKAQPQGPNHHLLVFNNRIQECRLDTEDSGDPPASLNGRESRTEQENTETPSVNKAAY